MWGERFIQLIVVVLCAWSVAAGQPAQIIYVDAAAVGAGNGSSWADAYDYLQDALAAASAAAKPIEIRVAQGVYKPDRGADITPGDETATFQLLNGVALQGGYAGLAGPDPDARDVDLYTTVLSGDLNDDDGSDFSSPSGNSSIVVTGRLIDATVIVEGVTITGGDPNGMLVASGDPVIRRCRFVANRYTGLHVSELPGTSASAPVVVACTFRENRTGMYNEQSSPQVTDCMFEGNERYGMESIQSSGLVLANCRFTENGYAGIHGWDCRAVLTNCVFERNGTRAGPGAAAIDCPSDHGPGLDGRSSHLTLADCIFRENEEGGLDVAGTLDLTRCSFAANDGEAVRCWGTLTARHCTFVANEGSRAGAIRCLEDFTLRDVEFDCTLLDCEFIGNQARGGGGAAVLADGNTLTATRCVFAGNTGSDFGAGAIDSSAKVMRLSHCTFTGNTCRGQTRGRALAGVGAVSSSALVAQITNCTFAGNRGEPSAFEHRGVSNSRAALTQCIVWDGEEPFTGEVSVTYSNVQGGHAGDGNMELDPWFVAPGHWETGSAPNDQEDDVWVMGDYHLKSQAGHWDRETQAWIFDDVTSACIDAGDPNGALGAEPFPNGGFVNLGAYGGTAEASRSYFGVPVCETHIAGDINGDCQVDDLDMDIMLSHWLMQDIGRANLPPRITIISPEDGAELTDPTPIVLRVDTSDPDGTILQVSYTMEHHHGTGTYTTWVSVRDSTDGWSREHRWIDVPYDGTYVVRAEAIDDDGAKTVSPAITITLHPAD